MNNQPCCAPGGPVLTWAVDGTARTIVPPVGFPRRESEHKPGSPCQWSYTSGPGRGGKPVTFLRIERRRGRSPECWSPEGWSPSVQPDGNPKPETRPVLRRASITHYPLSTTESVVSGPILLHLHTEKHLAISTIAAVIR